MNISTSVFCGGACSTWRRHAAFEDNAGCGAGAVHPEFVQRLRDGDRSEESAA